MPSAAGEAVGVLSLQGDFARHAQVLGTLGVTAVRVTLPEDLQGLGALILPGGESSTVLRLLASTGLRAGVQAFVRSKPVLGTCAGLILLSKSADKLPAPTFGAIDIDAVRNGYGRQVHSFSDTVRFTPARRDCDAVFIRAPRITRLGRGVEVIATHAGEPVGVRQGRAVALAFHPELAGDSLIHEWFLREVVGMRVATGAGA